MRCPSCGYEDSKVVDSRPTEDCASIRRRRECLQCGYRFTTYERLGDSPLIVIKSDGSSEVYDREKLFRGILTACAKRPVSPERIGLLIDEIELKARSEMKNEITSAELGTEVLNRLRILDEVAYIRFASVYQDFKDIDGFRAALNEMF